MRVLGGNQILARGRWENFHSFKMSFRSHNSQQLKFFYHGKMRENFPHRTQPETELKAKRDERKLRTHRSSTLQPSSSVLSLILP